MHPHQATLLDRVAVAFELLGRPTPYAMRALAAGLVIVAIGASTAVASAGTVADDALYSVKISSEQMRLALAASPEDRAVVQLSIAEHRLAEATALATLGNEHDAIVATSEYGEHMANAAAELAQVESLQPETATLVIQLQQRIDEHRAAAALVVARLAEDPNRASAAAALAAVASRGERPADLSPAAAIAQEAADTAHQAASVAERLAVPLRATAASSSKEADRGARSDDEKAESRDSESARGEATGVQNEKASKSEKVSKKERAAEASRKAADEAKAAAKKAKEGSRRTPAPRQR